MAIKGIDNIKKALEKYKGTGKSKFFQLEDDGDTATVRFLHKGEDDLNVLVVHKVKINGKERQVECIADENGNGCPLCVASQGNREISFPQVKMFLYLIDRRDGEVKLWERGRQGIPDILGLVSRYGDLNNRDYEIQRHGVKKDTNTKYQLFPMDKKAERNLPQRPEVAGEKNLVLRLPADKLEAIADGTYAPEAKGNSAAADTGEDVF